MPESLLILIYFFIITALQSFIGVGILVLGTPFLLILDYNIVEIFFILLPLSIITSLLNVVIIKLLSKEPQKNISKELKKFFIICIPSIVIGLLILKFFESHINFKVLVSLIIIFSVIFVTLKNKIKFKINFFRISILSIVGVIHGLTNSGGTLLSLALSVNNKKNYARFNITLFYLILATFQYLLTIMIFYENFIFLKNIHLVWVILFGVLIGNIFNRYINEKKYKLVLNLLAILSSLLLLMNN